MRENIVVIGAGISGLVAAYKLQKRGFDVTVLESSSHVGGRMYSEEKDGFVIDGGAQFLSSGYTVIPELIDEFGLRDHFVETSPYVGVVKNRKIRRFRYDKPFSLLMSGLLGFRGWFAMGTGGLKLQNMIKDLPTNNYSKWSRFDDQDTKSWSDDFYGAEVTDYFMEPLLEAFYFQSPEQTSKALPIALTKLSLTKAKTKTLRGGINTLAKAISAQLNIELDTEVDCVKVDKEKVTIAAGEKTFECDRVIIATPAPITKSFYKFSNQYESKLLDTGYSSTLNIIVALKNKLPHKILDKLYGIWIPRSERDIISAIAIESAKSEDRAPGGEMINIMLSGEAGRVYMGKDNDEVLQDVLSEIEKYIPNISKDIRFTKIFRWQHAEPISYVGRAKDIQAYKENLSSESKVYLAGDYMSMPFTEGAAQSGDWVASMISKKTRTN